MIDICESSVWYSFRLCADSQVNGSPQSSPASVPSPKQEPSKPSLLAQFLQNRKEQVLQSCCHNLNGTMFCTALTKHFSYLTFNSLNDSSRTEALCVSFQNQQSDSHLVRMCTGLKKDRALSVLTILFLSPPPLTSFTAQSHQYLLCWHRRGVL